MPIKHYLLIVIEFFSALKVSCGLSNNNHCKLLMANVLQWKQCPMLIRRLWWGWSHTVVGHLLWNAELLFIKRWSGIAINIDISKKLICSLWLYILIRKIKSISQIIVKKVVTIKYLAKFQSPRAITRPKIIGPERNVNLICNSSLYTHIPKIKSISPSIAKKSGDN